MTADEILARGRTAEVYDWEQGKVLKLFRAWCPPGCAESEASITDEVYRAGLPVPEVFEVIEWKDRQGIVFERIEGVSVLDACVGDPRHAEEYGRLLADVHLEIHGSSIESLTELRPMLARVVRDSGAVPFDRKKTIVSALDERTGNNRLCHMDFHPDQVLMTGKGPRIIDWETAGRGNPLADAARTSLIMRIGRIPRPRDAPGRVLEGMRGALVAAYTGRYFASQGRECARDMALWKLVAAIARLAEGIEGEREQLDHIVAAELEACREAGLC